MAGRGSFIESFPLFGYDLDDYDALFEEKLDLLLALRDSENMNWAGRHRPAIQGLGVYPRPVQDPLPVWIAVGGTPQSVVRAGVARASDGARDHRRPAGALRAVRRAPPPRGGRGRARRPALSINSHGFIADDMRTALDLAYPAHKVVMDKIGRERGWPPMTRAQFEAGATLQGHNVTGSPAEVIEKILFQHSIFDHDRFLLQLSVGTLPHDAVMRAIELYGTEVAPAVRDEVARRRAQAA